MANTSLPVTQDTITAYLRNQLQEDYVLVGDTICGDGLPMSMRIMDVEFEEDGKVILSLSLSWRQSLADRDVLLTHPEADKAERGVTWEFCSLRSKIRYAANAFSPEVTANLRKVEASYKALKANGEEKSSKTIPWITPGPEGFAFKLVEGPKGYRMSQLDIGTNYSFNGSCMSAPPEEASTIARDPSRKPPGYTHSGGTRTSVSQLVELAL